MSRDIYSPIAEVKQPKSIIALDKGGTGARTKEQAVINLGGISKDQLGIPGGLAKLGSNIKLPGEVMPPISNSTITVVGPKSLNNGQSGTYTITNYDIETDYSVSASNGVVTISDDTVTYIAPGTGSIGGFNINSKAISVNINQISPNKPNVISPLNGATGLVVALTFSSNAFSITGYTDTHSASDWQLATDAAFNNIVVDTVNDGVAKTSWSVTGLINNTIYYVRVRHIGTSFGYSEWSNTISFTTLQNTIPAIPAYEQAILTASDKAASDNFGYSVSISADGNTAIVGAVYADPSGLSNAGKAYIFTRSGTTWTEQSILTASDKAASDNFGMCASISGDGNTAIVGAYQADPSGITNAGKAYIFTRSGSTWTEQAILTASDKAVSDSFGVSVSISADGNTAIVGAVYADPSSLAEAGKAYIFTRSGTTWTEQSILTASDKAASDRFGGSVSISADGSTVIVGAYTADPSSLTDAGKVYIFTRSGTTWTEQAILIASDKAASDYFGQNVSISADGNTAIVGAERADPPSLAEAGKAYIYTRSGTIWTEQTILTASDKAASDYFGYSISISADGNTAIVGAYYADPSGLSNAGKAYIFTRSGSTWTEQAILIASDKAVNDRFGYKVAISGDSNTAIVCAYTADPSGIVDAGKVYIFGTSTV